MQPTLRPRRTRRARSAEVALLTAAQALHTLVVAASWRGSAGPLWEGGGRAADDLSTRLALMCAGLAIAVGLWHVRRWAWVAAMLWGGASMAVVLVAYLRGVPSYPVMVVSLPLVFYLNQREIQEAFRGGRRETLGRREDGE